MLQAPAVGSCSAAVRSSFQRFSPCLPRYVARLSLLRNNGWHQCGETPTRVVSLAHSGRRVHIAATFDGSVHARLEVLRRGDLGAILASVIGRYWGRPTLLERFREACRSVNRPLLDMCHAVAAPRSSFSRKEPRALGLSQSVRYVLVSASLTLTVSLACNTAQPGASATPTPADVGGAAAPLQSAAGPAPSPASSPRPSLPSVIIRRGLIAETVTLPGRVSSRDEVVASFSTTVTVGAISVVPGQSVGQGQVLVEVDVSRVGTDLETARTQLREAEGNLQQPRAQLEARLAAAQEEFAQATSGPSESEQLSALSAINLARASLVKAEGDLARLTQPPNAAELTAAHREIEAAAINVAASEAEVARLGRGPDPLEIRKAESEVRLAESDLATSRAALKKLQAGPDPGELQKAEADVGVAQAAVIKAQNDIEKLGSGPDQYDVEAAKRAVRQAEADLRAARARTFQTRAEKDAAITRAETTVSDAKGKLDKLSEGPKPGDLEAARVTFQNAKRQLDGALERLAVVRRGPSAESIQAAEAQVVKDQQSLDEARNRLELLRQGSAPDAVQAAATKLASARSAYAKAQKGLADLLKGPSPDQIQAAQMAAEGARLSVSIAEAKQAELQTGNQTRGRVEGEKAQAKITLLQSVLAGQALPFSDQQAKDIPEAGAYLQGFQAVANARSRVSILERALEARQLLAPADGRVSAVHVRAGDVASAGRPVVRIARSSDLIVRVDLQERDSSRLTVGQSVSVQPDQSSEDKASGQIIDLQAEGDRRVAIADIAWGSRPPSVGASVQTTVVTQQKENVLIVPQQAIRVVGGRRYVDVLEGNVQRRVEVEVGIVGDREVEVVKGLSEGQIVLVGL